MSNFQKRVSKPQRPRKKPQGMPHSGKGSFVQSQPAGGEIGVFANPHVTFNLARCFLGNVGEVQTKTHKCMGVIKAVAPDGGFGMKCVRSSQNGTDDGPFELHEDKLISLNDIKKIVLRNVNPIDVQKEDAPQECVSSSMNDPDTCLEHFFHPSEDAEEFNLVSDDNFPPEEMFAINKKKFNVTSSYNDNLEGYTVAIDKSDPKYKEKAEHYAEVAKAMEEEKAQGANWENMADADIENNEELRFSAVIAEGVQGRDFKNAFSRGGRRGGRGNNRGSIPRDLPEQHRPSEPRPLKSAVAPAQPQEKAKAHPEPLIEAKPQMAKPDSASDKPCANPKSVSKETAVTTEASSSTPPVAPDPEHSKANETSEKKEEKKKFTLDPDAPEFKPSSRALVTDPSSIPQPVPVATFPFNAAQYSQGVPCPPLPMPPFAVANQHPIPNGTASGVPFSIPSSMPCMMPPQLATLRQPQPGAYPHQQLPVMPQQLPVSGALPTQPSVAPPNAGPKGPRQNTAGGTYGRQRSQDQPNQAGPQMPFSIFSPHTFPFVQTGYPFSLPFIPTVSGSLPTSAYPGVPPLASTIPVSQASGQAHPPPPQGAQGTAQAAQNPQQAITSVAQPQFHPGYNPQLGQGQPAALAAYAHYPAGLQAHPGALGFYPQSALYQQHNLIPMPVQPLGANNQPPQVNSQLHHQGQQPLVPPQSLQLQPGQQQQPGNVQPLQQQQQGQPQVLLQNAPYIAPHLFAMPMGVPQQGVQNALNMPQNVHGQPHTMPIYLPQQSNGNT